MKFGALTGAIKLSGGWPLIDGIMEILDASVDVQAQSLMNCSRKWSRTSFTAGEGNGMLHNLSTVAKLFIRTTYHS